MNVELLSSSYRATIFQHRTPIRIAPLSLWYSITAVISRSASTAGRSRSRSASTAGRSRSRSRFISRSSRSRFRSSRSRFRSSRSRFRCSRSRFRCSRSRFRSRSRSISRCMSTAGSQVSVVGERGTLSNVSDRYLSVVSNDITTITQRQVDCTKMNNDLLSTCTVINNSPPCCPVLT